MAFQFLIISQNIFNLFLSFKAALKPLIFISLKTHLPENFKPETLSNLYTYGHTIFKYYNLVFQITFFFLYSSNNGDTSYITIDCLLILFGVGRGEGFNASKTNSKFNFDKHVFNF